jgi:VanZ family protein
MTRTLFRTLPQLGFAAAFALLALVVYLSLNHATLHIPGDVGGRFSHMAAYGALMFMYARMYARTRERLVVAAVLVLIGVGLELAQAATSYRTFEYGDIVANTIGVALGGLVQRTVRLIAWRAR